jgi:hypothetical protein
LRPELHRGVIARPSTCRRQAGRLRWQDVPHLPEGQGVPGVSDHLVPEEPDARPAAASPAQIGVHAG